MANVLKESLILSHSLASQPLRRSSRPAGSARPPLQSSLSAPPASWLASQCTSALRVRRSRDVPRRPQEEPRRTHEAFREELCDLEGDPSADSNRPELSPWSGTAGRTAQSVAA